MTPIRLSHLAQLLFSLPALLGLRASGPKLGVSRGRHFTTDSKAKPRLLSVAEQEKKWLEESCLIKNDLPGELVKGNQRLIHFFDLSGKRISDYSSRRMFVPDTGFGAGVPPENKYLNPAGTSPRLYIPNNNKTLDWSAYAKDPAKPLYITEGAKKAACLNKIGFPAVAVEGCWGWRAIKHGHILLPEFNSFALEGRPVFWVPDRDLKPKAVYNVGMATDALALVLQDRGAEMHAVELPMLEGDKKIGVDDFCYHQFALGQDKKAVQKALKELFDRTGVYRGYDLTDPGNVARWVSLYNRQFRYVNGSYYCYENGCWRPDTQNRQQQTTIDMFAEMQESARLSGNTEYEKRVKARVTKPWILNVGALANSHPAIEARPEAFDQHPYWVNCPNGVLEMPTTSQAAAIFREHRPEDMLTKQTAVPYDANAECPVFLKALDFWTNSDRDLQRTIQQLLGMSLTGHTQEQIFVILYGPGGSGKSVLMETVGSVLHDYAKTVPSDTLLKQRNGQPEERKLALLPGVRLISCSETATGEKIDENLIKLMTGQDTVAGRLLYKEQMTYKIEGKIWLRTNNRPVILGTAWDMWRRVKVIPFGRTVPENKKDGALGDKLRLELAGVFAWMVRGFLDYAQNGMYWAPVVEEEVSRYRKEQDVIELFFTDRCDFGPGLSAGRQELYDAYVSYCDGPIKRRMLTNELFKGELLARFADRIHLKQISVTVEGQKPKRQEWRWVGVATKMSMAKFKRHSNGD